MKPEILSPAGNMEKLKSAFLWGADAVYLAGQRFGMRAAAGNFDISSMKEAVSYAHALNKKVYVTVNVMARQYEFSDLQAYLYELSDVGADALIVGDLGVLCMAKEILPNTPIHISTQASSVNAKSIDAWHKLGASRVVLARELTLSEIKEIKRNISAEVELEAFVHGSMCVSYSGRCLLSNYLMDRDGNRGACAQPCRWNYRFLSAQIVEEKRPDSPVYIQEAEGETFIMSSKDMCMIEHVDNLIDAGINSFKIEGRMKSAYYCAVTANAYRMAVDDFFAGKPYRKELMHELESVSHRTYGTGYFYTNSHTDANLSPRTDYVNDKAYLAKVLSYNKETGLTLCEQRNKYVCTDSFEYLTPGQIGKKIECAALFDLDMNPIESTPHPYMQFYIRLPLEAKEGDMLRACD